MNEIFRAYKHARFLLALNSKADLSRRLNLLCYLTDSGYVDVEIRQMADVSCFATILFSYKDLTV